MFLLDFNSLVIFPSKLLQFSLDGVIVNSYDLCQLIISLLLAIFQNSGFYYREEDSDGHAGIMLSFHHNQPGTIEASYV